MSLSTAEAMALATRLTERAESAGIRIFSVFVVPGPYPMLTLIPEERELVPALAVELGLTKRRMVSYDAAFIENFSGRVEGVDVDTQHTVAADSLAVA